VQIKNANFFLLKMVGGIFNEREVRSEKYKNKE